MTKRKKKTKGEKGTKEETKQNPVCLSKKKKKKAKLKTQVMLEQQHRGALVQIYSLQFCPQFFQGENTQAARPYSTKHPPKPNITFVFRAPPLIIHTGNAIIFQIEKKKKSRKKKKQQRDQRGETQDNKLQYIIEMATHFAYL